MSAVLSILGLVLSFFMIVKREAIGDLFGEAEWMGKVGGVYNVVVLAAVLLFFWCIAELTGTSHLLFKPLIWLFPGGRNWEGVAPDAF
jgi:hypothetical protein